MANQPNLQQAKPTAQPATMPTTPTAQPNVKDALRMALAEPSIAENIAKTCGKHQDIFVASVMEVFSTDGKLRQCDPRYIIAEALKSVTLGLPLNRQLGFAYIIPFNEAVKDQYGNKVYERDANGAVVTYSNGKPKALYKMTPHLVIGYKGYIQMALRTGFYRHINADVVYEGQFRTSNLLTGEFDFSGEKISNRPVGYFAYIELMAGFSKTLYMSIDEMCHYAKTYGNSIGKDTNESDLKKIALLQNEQGATGIGWQGDFEGMAKKTMLRQVLTTYGIITTEMANVIAMDSDYSYSSADVMSNGETKTVIDLGEANVVTNEPSNAADTGNAPVEDPGF